MIPFIDLKAQHKGIAQQIDEAIRGVLESTQFVLGSEVAAFEEEFAAYSGARYGVAVNSGTSALHLALLASGIGAGDEVITVPYTFVATAAAVDYAGARTRFVDIDPTSLTMDVAQLDAGITARTRAILPVHLFGHPADMDPILEIGKRHGLMVIEDAAQAHGAEYKGRRLGSLGDMGCFSFYPSKNLGACGEAGMVVTNDQTHARTMRMLRDWGQERKYHHVLKGFNYRMDGIQAAVLRVKLRYLDQWTDARRAHAALYNALLAQSGGETPREMPYARHVYHIYAFRTPNRDALQNALQTAGVQTAIHYPTPIHLMPPYAGLGYRVGDFPRAEALADEELSLPLFPELTPANVAAVAERVCASLPRVRGR